jgi:signal transduction histidine kinase
MGGERHRLPRFGQEEDDAEPRELTSVRLASVGMVTSGLAHQIGNPLAAVVANLDVALDALRESPRADLAEICAALEDAAFAADQMTKILQSLTTFVRGGKLERRKFDIPDVVDEAVRIAGRTVRARAALATRVEPTPPVFADERLVHVLVNLLENAARSLALDSGTEVRIVAFTDAAGRAVIEVSDAGPGIHPAHLSRVFDPYVDAESAVRAGGRGSADLGLWICHKIVEDLGGEIGVESELGRGATFRLAFSPEK